MLLYGYRGSIIVGLYLTTIFITGLILGFVASWLVMRLRLKSNSITFSERLNLKDLQIQELRQSLDSLSRDAAKLSDMLKQETERRAAAEVVSERVPGLEERVVMLQEENTNLKEELSELNARMEEERKSAQEKLELLTEAQKKLSDAFKAISAEALRDNNQSFLELAKATLEKFHESARGDLESRQKAIGDLVKPVQESLTKVDNVLHELEKARISAYSGLTEQIKALSSTQNQLKEETSKLVRALRSPVVRGRW